MIICGRHKWKVTGEVWIQVNGPTGHQTGYARKHAKRLCTVCGRETLLPLKGDQNCRRTKVEL